MTQRVLAWLRPPDLRGALLLLATLLGEAPVIAARVLTALLAAGLLLFLAGDSTRAAGGLLLLGFLPTAWSLSALLSPAGGGWWWRQKLGGRRPSRREQAAYLDAIDTIRAQSAEQPRLPISWFVIDVAEPDAAVCGEWLMLSRGLLASEWLAPVLAHELGHVNSSDGKLTAAINRLVINPPARTRDADQARTIVLAGERLDVSITLLGALIWLVRRLLRFLGGGFALKMLARPWAAYWRGREYAADAYAARLGQAEQLAEFLEHHALLHDHPVPFMWLTEETHPPTELRIDRLHAAAERQEPSCS